MAYDTDLADRIRESVATRLRPGESQDEKAMFAGLGFMVDGHMAVAASGHGGLMVRVPAADRDELLQQAHVEPMVMSGRETAGWLRVGADAVAEQADLVRWVDVGLGVVRALPPKG